MTPGPEMDAAVAEMVMGWHRRKDFWATAERWDSEVASILWSPSTDIAAAWLVVEKMAENGNETCIYQRKGQWVVTLTHDQASGGYVSASDVPWAICRAALAAVGG